LAVTKRAIHGYLRTEEMINADGAGIDAVLAERSK
jgi:hypothetical protein